jgi:hypothetical protein
MLRAGFAPGRPLEKVAATQTKVAAAQLNHFSLREK